MPDLVTELREYLPPVIAGPSIDELTGNAIRWRTIQNKRADRTLPEGKRPPDECFVRSGTKVLIRRDPFLEWFGATLTDARAPFTGRKEAA